MSSDGKGKNLFYGERWLAVARLAWLILILIILGLFVLGIPARYQEINQVCATVNCAGGQLSPDQLESLRQTGFSIETRATFLLMVEMVTLAINLALAGLLIWGRSQNLIALMVGLTFVSFNADSTINALVPQLPAALAPVTTLATIGGGTFPVIFYLFPDGRSVPRWTRYLILGWFGFLFLGSLSALIIPEFQTSFNAFLPYLWVAIFAGSLLSQVYRFRVAASQVQRQQIKWIVYGLSFLLVVGLPVLLSLDGLKSSAGPSLWVQVDLLEILLGGLFIETLIPLTFGIAILRYRLWDIDLIIRRTVAYALLTGTLAAIYFGSVVVLQSLLSGLGSGRSQAAIVLSTLGIAALFNPLRRRIQEGIDRRFYRRAYDAERVLAEFSAASRDEVDVERLAGALLAAVERTLQPGSVDLRLREKPGRK